MFQQVWQKLVEQVIDFLNMLHSRLIARPRPVPIPIKDKISKKKRSDRTKKSSSASSS